MQVSVIITTYNQPESLLLTLKSLQSQTLIPNEIIVADDGSGEATQTVIIDFIKNSNLKVVHSWQKDAGFRAAKSRNKSIALSTSEYIILVDGDMILHENFIQDHINNSEIGYYLQGSRVLLTQKKSQEIFSSKNIKIPFFSSGLNNRKNGIHSVFLSLMSKLFTMNEKKLNSIRSCNMSFYKEDCIRINGFNNNFEGWGREDSEFIVRLLNSGIKRKTVRFGLIQYHLWHNESSRNSLEKNTLMLEEAISNKSVWCKDGINRYL